ncbi:Phosphate uptake regulator PhoU [Methanonatronarchaeum thermophilum]|uniref:Phosphate-specific transport system accessory protein PhoU n=1 Tax=Methanonatronarchaeum thermophilum TaxID=1927129 RepID=A0A1Y3GFM0_9EURY|nr:phosphate signaling complex protein PhoU [Methanonatronarchaeum thermophilum]OUJ18994.1 Phosphate uptake regulator PhoU [Methanonatronarchaeum thermophilum]
MKEIEEDTSEPPRRKSFEEAIEETRNDILKLCHLSREAICKSVEILENYDAAKIEQVYEIEEKSNKITLKVEKDCMRLITLHQPVASDLRFIASMMKISDNLERICDLGERITIIAEKRGDKPPIKPLVDTKRMVETTSEMIEIVENSIMNKKIGEIESLSEYDDIVDEAFTQIQNELFIFMVKDPKTVDEATDLLFVARYLERAGDLVCKIGARIVYMLEGRRVRIK